MLAMLISLSTANDAEVRQYAAFAVVKIGTYLLDSLLLRYNVY
jgi:vesicle coat complex subunit